MQVKKLNPIFSLLGTLCCLTLFAAQAHAACGDGMANVTNACETAPSSTTYNQSSMDQTGETEGQYEGAMALARTLESAASDNRSTAASCRAAGSTCAAECSAEAAAERAKIQPCDSGDDEDSDSASCEAANAAHEAEAARLEAIGAMCASTSESSASVFEGQASNFDSAAAQARKTAAAAKAAQGKVPGQLPAKPPAESLSSGGGGGGGKVDNSVYSDRQCLSADDAFKHVSCTDRYIKQCKDKLADPRCQKFAKHYCEPPKAGSEEVAAVSTTAAEGEETEEEEEEEDNYRQPSEGVGTGFCQFALSTQFCAGDNRGHCPSCANLPDLKACSQKSEVCLPTLSDEEKMMAQASCPLDPLFLNADFRPTMPDTEVAEEPEEEEPFVGDGTMVAVEPVVPVASDIYPAASPSLFSSQSRAIQKRCEQGMLNCGE